MVTFQDSNLWKRTLAARNGADNFADERERLRAALLGCRDRAATVAAEISRDLPDYTVHDITHLDSLWSLADLIAGPQYQLTPTEAFVLGGSFLIHDLGNGLAAYPDGIAALYSSAQWKDAVSVILRKKCGRAPTPEEIEASDNDTRKLATEKVLRLLHAQQAERLALVSWKDPDNGTERFLIEDAFLRQTYGRLIGRIAHSHWWSIDRLKPEFETVIGSPVTCPPEWTVDPLKVACLLRVSDAAHLDARRAPSFLKTIRRPAESSRPHWSFQERLQQPICEVDRLIYTSSQPFPYSEAPAWWLCFDALQTLDQELTGVDSVLADCSRPRFAVRGIQGAEDASRLSKWLRTDNWVPVDTRIKVTDVAELASRLGGAQLYGEDNLVPLRELIQNASDAIRARRFLERKPVAYGAITVKIGSDADGHWVEVADNGIGMSEAVMTGPLLDFGSSFWNSERMMQELPGLASSGFDSTGKYGIGFFSLFMWGNRVQITSRSYRDAARDSLVLEFTKGLHARPILRRASSDEYLTDGGTRVRIWVEAPPESKKGIFFQQGRRRKRLEDICEWLCPAIDTNLYVQRGDRDRKRVVEASDWKRISGVQLLKRLTSDDEYTDWAYENEKRRIPMIAERLRTVENAEGEIVGRVAVIPEEYWGLATFGVVTAGGIRTCALRRIAGILAGETTTASRTYAIPIVGHHALEKWATLQANLLATMDLYDETRAYAADTISRFGGDIGSLPIAEAVHGFLSEDQIRAWHALPDEIVLTDAGTISSIRADFRDFRLANNVLACHSGQAHILNAPDGRVLFWPEPNGVGKMYFTDRSAESRAVQAIADRWSTSLKELLKVADISDYPKYYWGEVGTIQGKPIKRRIHILRNPRTVDGATKAQSRRRRREMS